MYRNLNVASLGVSGRQSELIELALTYKFHGLDLDMAAFAKQVELRGAEHARRYLHSAGIRVGSFELPVRWQGDDATYQKDLDRLKAICTAAQDVGAGNCLTTVMPASDERSFQDNFEFHRARFGGIAEVLAPYGIRLGLGFLAPAYHRQDRAHQFIVTPNNLLTLMKMVVGSNVGVCVDLWHWHVAGGTIDQLRDLSADQIVAVRLADLPANRELGQVTEKERLLPGATGVVPVAAAMEHLYAIGYEGPVTPYAHPKAFSGLTRDQIVQHTSSALMRVWPGIAAAAGGPDVAEAESETELEAEDEDTQSEERNDEVPSAAS